MKPKTDIDERLLKNLETFQSIDIEKDWRKVKAQMGFKKQKTVRYLWQTAAAVIMLLGVGYLAQKLVFPSPALLTVQSGEQVKELVLPDGSRVTLNKQAELSYPEEFHRRQRKISLVGEAFFDVVSNPKSAFIVDINRTALVRVLGTSFNICPDENYNSITVQVLDGKVAFSSASKRSEKVILLKDEQATYNAGSIVRADTVDRNFISWKTGQLFFVHENIKEVFMQLESHYGVDIIMDESVPPTLTLTSTLDNQDLESVLNEISLVLGLEYAIKADQITFKKSQ